MKGSTSRRNRMGSPELQGKGESEGYYYGEIVGSNGSVVGRMGQIDSTQRQEDFICPTQL